MILDWYTGLFDLDEEGDPGDSWIPKATVHPSAGIPDSLILLLCIAVLKRPYLLSPGL
jgi:hypothetical protein